MLSRDQLIRSDNGQTMGYCPTCKAATLHCRFHYDDAGYDCLPCRCASVPGHIPEHQKDSGLHFRINPGNGVGVMMVHYSADPDKNPETVLGRIWLAQERKQFHNRPHEWNRYYEISFRGEGGPRIFPEFDDSLSWKPDLEFDPALPLLVGFDYGTNHPACVFAQWTPGGTLHVLLEVLGDDPHIETWFMWIGRLMKIHFFKAMGMADEAPDRPTLERLTRDGRLFVYGDPHGGNQRDRHKESDMDFARKYGWRTQFKYGQTPVGKIRKARSLTLAGSDGQPRILLTGKGYWVRGSEEMPIQMLPRCAGSLLSGFMGAYHWKQNAKGVVLDPPAPDKSGYCSDLMDALLEIISNTYEFETGPSITPLAHSDTQSSDWSGAGGEAEPEKAATIRQFFFDPQFGIGDGGGRPWV